MESFDVWRFIGRLSLPILIVIVAIVMRLFKRSKPLAIKHYIWVYIAYIAIVGINALIPTGDKIALFIVAAIILAAGYLIEKALLKTKAP